MNIPRKRRLTFRTFTSCVFTVGGLLSAAAAAWSGPPSHHAPTSHHPIPTAWIANPSLVAQLGLEVKIGGWGIRPPRGYTLKQINMTAIAGGGLINYWMGPMRADKQDCCELYSDGRQ